MALNKIDYDIFRHYLLGKLTGDDLEAFEKRLLTDDEVFDELLAAEDDLFDEYAAGDLSRDERERFEKHFLITTERQEDVDFARTLRRVIKKKVTPTPTWWDFIRNQPWISRAAAVVVIGFVAVLAYQITRPQTVAIIDLTASDITRGDEASPPTQVNLGGFDILRISLKLPPDFIPVSNYRAELSGDTGDKTVSVIGHDTESVTVEISANELPPGQYALKLYAIDSSGQDQRIRGSYYFIVQ